MNPLLTKIEQGIESKVLPKDKVNFNKVVLAGEKIMFDEKTHQNMELIKTPESRKDPVSTIASGITGLMWLMYQQSKRTMSVDVMIMAGTVLMTRAIDFAENGLGIKFDSKMVADCTKALSFNLFKKLGVKPEQLNELIKKNGQSKDGYGAQYDGEAV